MEGGVDCFPAFRSNVMRNHRANNGGFGPASKRRLGRKRRAIQGRTGGPAVCQRRSNPVMRAYTLISRCFQASNGVTLAFPVLDTNSATGDNDAGKMVINL